MNLQKLNIAPNEKARVRWIANVDCLIWLDKLEQCKLDNMDTKKTCRSVRIIRMSVFQQTVTDTMFYRY